MISRDQVFIGGEWVDASGRDRIEIISPIDEEIVGRLPLATTDDIDRAVAAAREAFDRGPWPRMAIEERARALLGLAETLEPRLAELIDVQIVEMGSPRKFMAAVTGFLADWVRRDASTAEQIDEQELREGLRGNIVVRREPVGVVAGIVPWNAPAAAIISKLVPALLAGCPIVVKPAPESPLSAVLVADAVAEAGLPSGVVSIIPGGAAVGEHLVAHAGIDKVSFTGSTLAGRRIGAICGEQIKPVALELGGKSAAILLEDADLGADLPGLLAGALPNNGQVCHATTRILAPRSRYHEILDILCNAVGSMKVGDPRDPDTDIGPLVSSRQRDRVEDYIRSGSDDGATLVLGGGRPEISRGWYVEPTVFADVDNSMRIAREEIFGPVLAVIPYRNEEDVIGIANDSSYGLGGAVYTSDLDRGLAVAARIQTGTCVLNTAPHGGGGGPFGGVKQSGIGRERGREGIEAFMTLKTVTLPLGYVPQL